MLREKIANTSEIGKLKGDLHQPSGIRYVSRTFSVRCFISLAYWEGIDFCSFSVCFGTPKDIGSFLRNKIGDHTRHVPCVYLESGGIMCLISYTLLIIYARVGLTLYYIACLSCLLLLRAN